MTENVTLTLDIGGEGRHVDAWNLNPSATKTLGPGKGSRIPRHVRGRADAIPLADHSVDRIIVERTPLNKAALTEIARVIAPGGSVIMRHAVPFDIDPHAMAKAILPGPVTQRTVQINGQTLQESRFDNFGNDAGACRCSYEDSPNCDVVAGTSYSVSPTQATSTRSANQL